MSSHSNPSEIILYTTADGQVKIDTVLRDDSLWLTQQKMAELFGVQRPAITKHLKGIFESEELDEVVVSSILEHTTQHGATVFKMEIVQHRLLDTQQAVTRRPGVYQAEALEADREDFRQLEELEQKILGKQG